jgi:DNA-binding MarR family transcriptional regulator
VAPDLLGAECVLARGRRAHIVSSVNDVSLPPVPQAELNRAGAADLLAAIGAVRRVARRAVRSAYTEPLPPARSELLRLAARRPGIGVAEAAAELRLAPNSVSTMVSKLAEDGLLSRGRVASDGRSVRLTVTEAGAARVEEWRDIRLDLAARAVGLLAAEDQEALAAAVPALTRLAQQMETLLSRGNDDPPYPAGGTPPDRRAHPVATGTIARGSAEERVSRRFPHDTSR